MTWSIILGNGFTIDASKHCKVEVSPSRPWGWDIKNPYSPDQNLLDVLPNLKTHLMNLGDLPDIEVYGALQDIVRETQSRPIYSLGEKETIQDRIHAESCHYLRLAYALYSDLFTNDKLFDWIWHKWFSKNGNEVETILSFNYDLILERVMRMSYLGKVYGSSRINPLFGSGFTPLPDEPYWDEMKGDKKVIHVAKPHGSSNFTSWAITQVRDENGIKPLYPLNLIAVRSSPLRILNGKDIYKAVSVADLVLPGEWSCWDKDKTNEIAWASEQKQHFVDESKTADKLLVVGFGYGEPDRPEFNDILSRMSKFDDVYIVNPAPSNELLDILRPFAQKRFVVLDTPNSLIN